MTVKPTALTTKTLLLTTAALASTFASRAFAQTDAATAEVLFREGKKLMDQKNFAAACPKLAESQRLDPATGTLLALAMCHEGQGKTASAWVEYAEVASRSRQEGRSDREQAARDKGAALEAKLSTLSIAPSAVAAATVGLVVKRDGAVVGQSAWQTAVPVDPGEHKVEASAIGKKSFLATVNVGPDGDKKTVEIPALENDAGGTGTAGSATMIAPGTERSGLSQMQIGGISVGAAGLVAVGVGTYFGLRARKLNEDSMGTGPESCDANNLCGKDGFQKRTDAISAGNWSTISFAVGGALIAGGAALFVLGRGKETGNVNVAAAPYNDGGSLFVSGRF
jgi:hypothetical protein